MSKIKAFISHSSSDREWVDKFAKTLEDHGIDTGPDLRSSSPGELDVDQLEAALRSSDAIVAVLAPGESINPNVLFEMGVALGTNKPLLPIVSEGRRNLPWVDARLMCVDRGSPRKRPRSCPRPSPVN